MKKRKLKSFVLPTVYFLVALGIFTGVILLGRDVALSNKDYNYGVSAIKDNVKTVIVEDTIETSDIVSPVENDKADIAVHFYSSKKEEASQIDSLIYYENTYLPNTGILYSADEAFDVKIVFAGKVTDILDDEFFGKCIVVEHTSNLRTYYYGLDNAEVAVGDELTNGAVIGTSKNNTIMNTKKTFLLEVYHNNKLIDPENFIGTKITDYN